MSSLTTFMLIALIGATSCAQTVVATPQPSVVEIAGATSMHPVLEALADAFAERNPGWLVELRGGGSTIGEQRVTEGRSALGASTLLHQNGENDDIDDAVHNNNPDDPIDQSHKRLQYAPIGIDAIAIVVNSDNPIDAVTSQQLRDLFSGRVFSWAELGGVESDVLLVSREDGSGARHTFESRIMGDNAVSLTARVMPTSADVVEYVSKNPYAIGYVSCAYVSALENAALTDSAKVHEETPVHVVAVDGVLPSDDTVMDQSYPLIQPLYLVTKGSPQGWSKLFIDFALSLAGQETVDRYHTRVR